MRGGRSGGRGFGGGGRHGSSGGYRNPCLTMHQPWASLLVHGIKRVEGRSWPAPVTGRLWIHAASKVPDPDTVAAMEAFYREIHAVDGVTHIEFPQHYPVSRLLGCVEVVGCVRSEELVCWEDVPESVRLEGLTDFCWLCARTNLIIPTVSLINYRRAGGLKRSSGQQLLLLDPSIDRSPPPLTRRRPRRLPPPPPPDSPSRALRLSFGYISLFFADQSPRGVCMTPPVALRNEPAVISHSERVDLFRGASCNIESEVLATLANGQDPHAPDTNAGFRVTNIRLPSGDSYSGTLLGSTPEGSGRYTWSDGCIYDGEWRRGMRHGQGKTLWPSGATYEGEYAGGYIYGEGTYTGQDNIVYKGRWKLNRKHGLGCQTYPNGDMFQGSWIQGEIQGHGKYTWQNGNSYTGNMKNGKMSGKGTFTWKNGDSYEGNWLDGMMHGYGIYTWDDCGYYVGTWTRGLKDGKGTLYPRGCRVPVNDEMYINSLRNRGVLPDLRRQNHGSRILHSSSVDMGNMKVGINRESSGASSRRNSGEQSRSKNVSLERRWSLEVAIEKFIGNENSETSGLEGSENIDDSEMPMLEREYMQGVLISEVVIDRSFSGSSKKTKRRQKKMVRETKKPGEAIIKGHRSYDLMLSLQLGIRYTVGKITPIQKREVRASDFGPRASFWMNFPKEGSRLTPSHPAEDFKWKDYCPMVFRNLREMFKIDAADYMISICGNAALRELSSPGKSGSVFFLSQDDRFMIKTLRKSEVQVLLRMLPKYYHHVHTYENTLITKFFGLHRVKPSSGQKFRFVVMGNMFCTELRIHRRFDLKGSSLGRSTDKIEIDENTTLKDLDLNYSFYLEPSWREALLKQIKIDSEFLKSQRIMDYSLLLGVHYRAPQHLRTRASYRRSMTTERLTVLSEEDAQEDDAFNYPEGLVLVQRANDENSVVVGPHIRGSRLRSSAAGFGEVDLLLPGTARVQIQLGVNMPARAEQIPKEDESKSFYEVYDVVLYLGIIDILQEYNITKKIEHAVKSMQYDSVSISAVDPEFYSERFLKFIQTIFPENS